MADTVSKNIILSTLSKADLALVEPYLESVDLPVRKVLDQKGKPFKAVYFPENGFASVVADGKRPIEIGVIGREGMTGIAVLLGGDRNDHDTYMQAAGHGHCIRTKHLREALDRSTTLHQSMLRYVQAFLKQTAQTAVANGRSKIEGRLARWLLMADDRIEGAELPLTHEFLAMMLSSRRPGVTEAVQELERASLIARKRGRIVILDRNGLEKLTDGTYTAT
jgi:CRP-like cAMP-binding protein